MFKSRTRARTRPRTSSRSPPHLPRSSTMSRNYNFAWSRDDIIRPPVLMHSKYHVPVLPNSIMTNTKPQNDSSSCHGFEDLLGVLNGYRRIGIVKVSNLTMSNADHASVTDNCMGRKVNNWTFWKQRVLLACQDAGMYYYWQGNRDEVRICK